MSVANLSGRSIANNLWPTRFWIDVRTIWTRWVVKQPGVEMNWVGAVVGLDQERFGGAQVTVWDRDIHGVRSMSNWINHFRDLDCLNLAG